MRAAPLRFASPFLLALIGACSGATATGFDQASGIGLGGDCDANKTCRSGLECVSGKCAATGKTADGAPCTIGAECSSGICGPAILTGTVMKGATCQSSAGGGEGASCGGDADCSKGYRCGFDGAGFFPKCVKEGAADLGVDCTKSADCLQGLVCSANRCNPPSVTEDLAAKGIPPFIPGPGMWQGAKCADNVKGDISALFQVPRATDAAHEDFYRLPFPNDAARSKSNGKVSFANHPHDPSPPMGFDAVKLYLDALESEPFSNFPSVYFRFDGDFDFDSVSVTTDDPQTRLVDLTTGPDFGRRLGLSIFLTNGRNRYICQNYVVVHPGKGAPLLPGHTYGVIMKKGPASCPTRTAGKCSGGTPAKQHSDFTAMVSAGAPGDATLKDAWDAYKPLRDWMTKEGKKADDLLVASVFTVGDPTRVASRLKTSVRTAAAPTATGWVKCGAGVKSPCPQADEADKRACGAGDPEFDEYHAMVDMPVFQQGTAPYFSTKDGGAINSSGGPTEAIAPVRSEKVCMAVTVPKGTPPAGGWPVALYAHGTGGSFRSHAVDGASKILSKVDLGGGASTGFAVIGIDQVEHGPRRGASTMSPNDLFFNFANPAAARFNALQGAADQHTLVRLAETLSITDGATTIKLDPKNLVYWGHSQGATEGAIFLASDTSVKGAVLSGEGATLEEALVTKTKPVNIKDALWLALSESGPRAVDANHPVLALLQAWADPADPLHYARAAVVVPGASATAPALLRNVFQPMGKDDTYTPFEVQASFALAAGLAFVGPEVIPGFAAPAASAQGNVTAGTMKATAAFRQYAPASARDGHFVAFDIDQAKTDLGKFLARSSRGETPKLPE